MQNDSIRSHIGSTKLSVPNVVSTVTPIGSEESILQEQLIDMFSSFDSELRRTILTGLEKSTQATNDELRDCTDPNIGVVLTTSICNLGIMHWCCTRAQEEFDDLDKDTTQA